MRIFISLYIGYSTMFSTNWAHQLSVEFRQSWLARVVENKNGADHDDVGSRCGLSTIFEG